MRYFYKLLFFGLFFINIPLSALTLGEVQVNSYINQKLNADIKVLSVSPSNALKIRAFLASKEDFIKYDIERSELLNDIRFVTYKKEDGDTYIHMSSQKVIREPLLSLIVNIRTVEGNLSREYNLFLNPSPETQPLTPVISIESSISSDDVTQPLTAMSDKKFRVTKVAQVNNTDNSVSTSYRPDLNFNISDYDITDEYGPTKSGQTITLIAQQIRPDKTYSIQKIAKLLYQINPNAFLNNDINRLKNAYILKLPNLASPDFRKDSYAHIDDENTATTATAKTSTIDTKTATTDIPASTNKAEELSSELKLVSDDYAGLDTSSLAEALEVTDDSLQAQELLNLSIEKMQILKEENQTLRDQFGILMIRMEEVVNKNEQLDIALAKYSSGDIDSDQQQDSSETEALSQNASSEVSVSTDVEALPESNPLEIAKPPVKKEQKITHVIKEQQVTDKNKPMPVTTAMMDSSNKNQIDWYFWGIGLLFVVLGALGSFAIWTKLVKRKEELTPEEFSMDKAWDDADPMMDEENTLATSSNNTASKKQEESFDFDLDLDEPNSALSSGDMKAEEANNDYNSMQVSQVSAVSSPVVENNLSAVANASIGSSGINFNDILAPSKSIKSNNNADLISQSSVYFAYGKFDLAEQLLVDGIAADPNNTKLQLKLFECYAKMDNEDKFMDYLEQAKGSYTQDDAFKSDISVIYSKQWDKALF